MIPASGMRAHRGGERIGEAGMTGILSEVLLFSCLATFVIGIVLAAASLLS